VFLDSITQKTGDVKDSYFLRKENYMAREKENYRDNLQRLDERFPDKELLNVKEAAVWLGVDPRTVPKLLGSKVLPGSKVSKVALAKAIS